MRNLFLLGILLLTMDKGNAQRINNYYPSGVLQYTCETKDGILHGDFVSYFDNGLVKTRGHFRDNQKTGTWQAWDSTGILRTKRVYRTGTDFEIISEWTMEGVVVNASLTGKKNELLHSADQQKDDLLIYTQRYWKNLQPGEKNTALFSAEFLKFLQAQADGGKIAFFADDRFVTPIAQQQVSLLLKKQPVRFIIKEDHNFFADRQRMDRRVIGLGLVYKEAGKETSCWLYVPDFLAMDQKPFIASTVISKLNDDTFSTSLDMTTINSADRHPRKVDEKEKISLVLSEVDFEAQAWIYLLNKELLASK